MILKIGSQTVCPIVSQNSKKCFRIEFVYEDAPEDEGTFDLTFTPIVQYFAQGQINGNPYPLWFEANQTTTWTIVTADGSFGGVYGLSCDVEGNHYDIFGGTPDVLYVSDYSISNIHTSFDPLDALTITEVIL